MAHQMIYKNVGIEDEASFGASTAGTAVRLHVTDFTVNLDPTKELIEDTIGNVKGRDRINRMRNVVEGDMNSLGSPRSLHHMFELANGTTATETAVGNSANLYTYNQNTSGTMLSKAVNVDRNNSQEKFLGLRGQQLELNASDSNLEASLSLVGKTRTSGVSMADIGTELIRPFIYADFTVTIGATANYYGSGVTTLKVREWNLSYNNNLEPSFLSGSRDIDRSDPLTPELTGSFSIFHTNDGLVNGTFGSSEYAIRLEAISTGDNGFIAGTGASGVPLGATPYVLTIDIPRVQLTTNVRNYEQQALSVEEINFTALFDYGSSALWTPKLTAELGL